jgi:hypothetical protein
MSGVLGLAVQITWNAGENSEHSVLELQRSYTIVVSARNTISSSKSKFKVAAVTGRLEGGRLAKSWLLDC